MKTKGYFFIFNMICVTHLYSQTKLPNEYTDSSLALNIIFHKDVVTEKKDLQFIMAVCNNSKSTIDIPSTFIESPKTDIGNLGYEILYFRDSDSIDITNTLIMQICGELMVDNNKQLRPRETYNFTATIARYHFRDPGKYKIRFILRASKIPGLSRNIFSEWAEFNALNSVAF